ncbi:tRNA dihydrouridine synthase DusB [Paraferrimonas sp. SM1919]|uniref:tRNA dihydrouridine synthase DusB n=1 Tax=Paraferrimonas sp. SM1919 TaxID=2662263 RepID=UPI0013D1A211|nr:tRNA dihydrouridine synthase DusB [Paraferrimonas sp. SM1919]
MRIGPHQLQNRLILAPMAGVTDQPFRNLCLKYGAALAVSEMLSSNPDVWDTDKSRLRMSHKGENGIRSVQIAGSDPQLMAQAAQFNVANGADIIDINMGCPAKKVNKKLAGSALLQDPTLVRQILEAVVAAVDTPVTLKIRTGWDPQNRNGVDIARIAQDCGISALAVHGRTRKDMYKGDAEYDTIAQIKQAITIPVIANGDIDSPEKAKQVLDYTGVDALMIGRPAQGRPWIFREIDHFLKTGEHLDSPPLQEVYQVIQQHLDDLLDLYGEYLGIRIARKHVGWYLNGPQHKEFRARFNRHETIEAQRSELEHCFSYQ